MFTCGRKRALEAVEDLCIRVCCYSIDQAQRCDCKYGGPSGKGGEQTGCPELRTVRLALMALTDEEFEGLLVMAEESKVSSVGFHLNKRLSG